MLKLCALAALAITLAACTSVGTKPVPWVDKANGRGGPMFATDRPAAPGGAIARY